MKKLLCTFICICLTVSLFSGCVSGNDEVGQASNSASTSEENNETGEENQQAASGESDPFGKYEEPVVIRIGQSIDPNETFPAGDTPENNQYTRYLKEMLNVEVEVMWQAAEGSDYTQKINLAIASNDLPDVLAVEHSVVRNMVKADQLEDLTDVIPQYVSPVMQRMFDSTGGEVLDYVTYDGKLMALPNVSVDTDGYHLMWIRQDWLDQLELEVPQTVDDLEEVGKAFIDNKMGGENTIGISGPKNGDRLYATFLQSTNNTYGFDPIFSAYNAYPGYWIRDDEGNTVYGSTTSETREALERLSDLYAKGILDPESGLRKDSAEPVISGQSGIFFGPWWMGYSIVPDTYRNDSEADWRAYAVPLDQNGEWSPHMSAMSNRGAVVRKGYENPEVVVKINNLLLRDESTFDLDALGISFFPVRLANAALDESQYSTEAIRSYLNGEITVDDVDTEIYKLLEGDLEVADKAKLEPYDDLSRPYWDIDAEGGGFTRIFSLLVGVGPIVDTPANKVFSETYFQTDAMASKWTNLYKLEQETFLKIIMGSAPIEEFDSFVEQWYKIGGDDITAEVQALDS